VGVSVKPADSPELMLVTKMNSVSLIVKLKAWIHWTLTAHRR
jgi:hypothetical protein